MSQLGALKAVVRGVRDGRLTAADCRLLVCVRLAQAFALLGITCAPVPAVRRALGRFRPWAIALGGRAPESRVIWAINASARCQAGHSTCLARALAAELLLPPAGTPLTVVIGVMPPVDGRLKSHAWLERNGRVVMGGDESRRDYFPLIAWTGGTA
jgi:hypothetical protein